MSVEKEQFEKVMGELRLAGVPAGTADVIQAFVDAQGAALSRVEAEAGRLAEAGLTAHVKATTLQAQLAEALGLLAVVVATNELQRAEAILHGNIEGFLDRINEGKQQEICPVKAARAALLARKSHAAQAERQECCHENA